MDSAAADDRLLRVGDWVQFPELADRPSISRRFAEVVDVDGGWVLVKIRGGHHLVPADMLTKVTWRTHAYHHLNDPAPTDRGDAGPFCRCGEPVLTQGQACRWCLQQTRDEEYVY